MYYYSTLCIAAALLSATTTADCLVAGGGSIHDIFLYLAVYMAYIHITLVTHIISILGSIPLFSKLFNIHIYFSCHGINFVYCI